VSDAKALITCCKNELEQLYPSGDVEQQDTSSGSEFIKVVMLTGDFEAFSYNPSTTVKDLKQKIFERFKVNPANQQLMYEESVLQVCLGHALKFFCPLFT
jgi:gamma-glutamylcysteine synthetase